MGRYVEDYPTSKWPTKLADETGSEWMRRSMRRQWRRLPWWVKVQRNWQIATMRWSGKAWKVWQVIRYDHDLEDEAFK